MYFQRWSHPSTFEALGIYLQTFAPSLLYNEEDDEMRQLVKVVICPGHMNKE